MPEYQYVLASPINVVEADRILLHTITIKLTPEEQVVEIVWYAYDLDKFILSLTTTVTINQWNNFLTNYASFPGTTFEEKVLNLADNVESRIPGGGSVVPIP